MLSKPYSALVIVGHGSTVNPYSSLPTRAHADSIRERVIFREVATCFWKEAPHFREIDRIVNSKEVYVVPNFLSEGYFTESIIPNEMQLVGPITERNGRVFKYCRPVGRDPRVCDLILKRAADVAPGVDPAEATLLIIAHGTDRDPHSAEAARHGAEQVRKTGAYAEVVTAFMETTPWVGHWDRFCSQPNVVAVPFFISDGMHTVQDIPELLGLKQSESVEPLSGRQHRIFCPSPYLVHGKQLFLSRALGTEPLFADIILEQVAAFDRTHPGVSASH